MNKEYILGTILLAVNERMDDLKEHQEKAKENIQSATDNEDFEYWIGSFNYWSKKIEECKEAEKFILNLA